MIHYLSDLDVSIFFVLNNLAGRSSFLDFCIVFFAEYVAYIVCAVFLLSLYYATYTLRTKITTASVVLFSIVSARFGVAEFIRLLYHRPRPFLTYHVHQLFPEASYSFPSGHATFFFAFSFAVYLYNKKLGNLLLVSTLLIVIARVISGVHYPSDIIGGAIIGIVVSYLVHRYLWKWFEKTINRYL